MREEGGVEKRGQGTRQMVRLFLSGTEAMPITSGPEPDTHYNYSTVPSLPLTGQREKRGRKKAIEKETGY